LGVGSKIDNFELEVTKIAHCEHFWTADPRYGTRRRLTKNADQNGQTLFTASRNRADLDSAAEVEGQAYCDVIVWAISKRIDAKLCLAALKSALDTRQHSDRGVHSTPLEGANMKISISRTGNPNDNAHMESFFKTLKYKEMHLSNSETYEDALEQLPGFVEEVYNKKRLHSALGYLSPEEYEVTIQQTKTADRAPRKSR
jgi:transposase InsO family protein